MSLKKIATFVGILFSTQTHAMPIGFGYNQGNLKFDELITPNFIVYHDARTPLDGKIALNALQAAKNPLERWFQVKRSSPLIVNMSAESENASFANFITDSIELQTMGQGSRDLAWHEYTHAMMYQHLDNFFGPAGAIIHLPWMDAWFLEGLAEAMSVSIGLEQQAGIERYHALQNDWPSWDRIHSLYTSGPFSYRGYATSGAFVSWILRTYGADKLSNALKKFRDDTMPWWWPWALTPFNSFWPMDSMLKDWTGFSGRDLYERYKTEATNHWKMATPQIPLSQKVSKQLLLTSAQNVTSLQGVPYGVRYIDGAYQLNNLTSEKAGDPITSWGESKFNINKDHDVFNSGVSLDENQTLFVTDHWPHSGKQRAALALNLSGKTKLLKRSASWISKAWLSKTYAWWIEVELESSRLCRVPRAQFSKSKVECPRIVKSPETLRPLGTIDEAGTTRVKEIWVSLATQSAIGNSAEILRIDAESSNMSKFAWSNGGSPQSMATSSDGTWLLMAGRANRYIRRFDQTGKCIESISTADFPVRIVNSLARRPWVVNWLGGDYSVVLPKIDQLVSGNCLPIGDHTSPILESVRQQNIAFDDAMKQSSPWIEESATRLQLSDESNSKEEQQTNAVKTSILNIAQSPDGKTPSTNPSSKPNHWRGRPVFAFPWIGADDALGPQLGIVSVPLMDHMQNETVRATALVGLYSRFPYQELSLVETRWKPTWTLSVYRSQTYNGRYRDQETDELFSSYLDEKGGRIDGSISQSWSRVGLFWNWGAKTGHLAPYIGSARHYGSLTEIYGGHTFNVKFLDDWQYGLGLQGRAAPGRINENFDYQILGLSTDVTRKINLGSLSLGIDVEKTRGRYRRDLQEMYTPLKTFVPGSGGGYNKNSFAITEDQGLFSPVFGDTQGRARLAFTHPVIEEFDKHFGLIYIDRLDFSAFLNHGTAWVGDKLPERSSFITAQGYNLDLMMDNKGVRFNFGAGVGQVAGNLWQIYSSAGFDALF